MPTNHSIAVVGGGLGGLAAACTLAARGHEVTLFERNSWVGGKAAVLHREGFRFDMGPTILTLPSVLQRIFAEAGREMSDYLELMPLDPQWRCFFEDETTLDLVADKEKMVSNIGSFAPGTLSGEGYRKWLNLSERLHDISDRYFFWKSIGGIKDMFDARRTFQPGTLGDVLAMRMGRTVAGTIRSFVSDERVCQMLDHFTQYVGSAPDASPAVLCGIGHMQTAEGIWYPKGGTRAVPEALAKLAIDLGVTIRTNTGVRRIITEKGRVSGLETDDGEVLHFGAVVANSDTVRTHRELLDEKSGQAFQVRRKYEPACSGVVLYLVLKKAYRHLLHHNFIFSRSPEEEFEYIYRKGEPAPDPTCYVCAPALTEPAVAPPGGEALYVLVHTPYLRPHQDWTRMLPAYRKVILNKLKKTGGLEDIEDRIVCEEALTPLDIHNRYHVLNGAIYGLASHGRFLGAFKPANRSPDIRGLYFAGGSAHPGPGMPMVLMSGWIAADTLTKDDPLSPDPDREGPRAKRAELAIST
ncbi:MAG: phytoene desaturase [Verrucomicrobiales bacterium]|nr:phytoene desaturase [Verrucomicrobiales bacterium]